MMDGNLTRPAKPSGLPASAREIRAKLQFLGGHRHDLELSLEQAQSSEASRRTA